MADEQKPRQEYPLSQIDLPAHFSLLSAQLAGNPHNQSAHLALEQELIGQGFKPIHSQGNFPDERFPDHPGDEESFLVPHNGTPEEKKLIEQAAWKYNQAAVAHSSNLQNEMAFQNGESSWKGQGVRYGDFKSHFTQLPSGHKFSLHFDDPSEVKKSDDPFDKLMLQNSHAAIQASQPHYYGEIQGKHVFHHTHPGHDALIGVHLHDPSDKELTDGIREADKNDLHAIIIHGIPPASIREKGMHGAHPHAYEWHEGHTDHYKNDSDPIEKAENVLPPTNDQAAHAGTPTFKPTVGAYGTISPGRKTNLQFYRGLEHAEPKIDSLIQQHGYQTYFAGGKYGKPDLKNKNYNTKHLMIYDPSPQSGGDFGEEKFTRSWRKLHELSHALTYPDLNSVYGEGRRMGKLGTRTPHEAKRAVHWEWLAAHKQREMAEGLGFKVSDQDFHRELNTIMADAVHRAVHGKFTEPSDEGFYPHSEKIPLEHSLKMVEDAAHKMGLKHSHSNLASEPKAELSENPLTKAFFQGDGETLTQPASHQSALQSAPSALQAWGHEKLVPMKKDDIEIFEMAGKIVKIRKVLEDLYSGWIESDGQKIHQFEKLTFPEVLMQLQSKLEIYGKEDEVVAKQKTVTVPVQKLIEEHEKLVSVLENPTPEGLQEEDKEQSGELEQYKKEIAPEKPSQELFQLEDIDRKIKELQAKLQAFKEKEAGEQSVDVPAQELVSGIENPEVECPACERPVADCICYTGLSKPRVEFDGKKFTIFFKSEWSIEDQENFVTDMKRRNAKNLLDEQRISKASTALSDIRKRLNGSHKD